MQCVTTSCIIWILKYLTQQDLLWSSHSSCLKWPCCLCCIDLKKHAKKQDLCPVQQSKLSMNHDLHEHDNNMCYITNIMSTDLWSLSTSMNIPEVWNQNENGNGVSPDPFPTWTCSAYHSNWGGNSSPGFKFGEPDIRCSDTTAVHSSSIKSTTAWLH